MSDSKPTPTPVGRSFLGGVLMGLANLVPGISGGTMILAIGLYDRFIGAVADVTRLRFSREALLFLGVMAIGLGLAVVSFSGVAVSLVAHHRWVMYSLFIGLTLGGVPELSRLSQPWSAPTKIALLLGLAGMAALAWGLSGTSLPVNTFVLIAVGAAAASSMILPGVSGSYVLLIFGMYDTVIGSLSAGELRSDLGAALAVILPVGLGALLGIGLLSNLLRTLLARWSGPSHGALLGLLCGSIFGLYPFQEAVHLELGQRDLRQVVEALVVEQLSLAEVQAEYGEEWDEEVLEALRTEWSGHSKGELKQASLELHTFTPGAGQVGAALALLALGFLATRALGRGRE